MEAEMDEHPGYQKFQRSDSDDYRNGYNSWNQHGQPKGGSDHSGRRQ